MTTPALPIHIAAYVSGEQDSKIAIVRIGTEEIGAIAAARRTIPRFCGAHGGRAFIEHRNNQAVILLDDFPEELGIDYTDLLDGPALLSDENMSVIRSESGHIIESVSGNTGLCIGDNFVSIICSEHEADGLLESHNIGKLIDPHLPATDPSLRQLATVLAALRYWQREGLMPCGHEHDIASHGETLTPLSADEIDQLCEELNCGGGLQPPSPAAMEFIGKIARMKSDGELYDSDGNLVDPAEHSRHVIDSLEPYVLENDDAVETLCSLIREARALSASHAPAGEGETPLLPDDFPLRAGEAGLGDVEVSVPLPLRIFARSMVGRIGSIAIANLYEDEAILCIDEQCPDERDALIADGWPERFVDFLNSLVAEGHGYIRLI